MSKLRLPELLKLVDLMQKDYTSSELNDTDYAKRAQFMLWCAVSRATVGRVRKSLDMPPNRPRVTYVPTAGDLELRVAALEDQMNAVFRKLGLLA